MATPTVWPARTLTSSASGVARPSMTSSRPSPVRISHTSAAVRILPPSPLTETKLTMPANSGKAAEVRTASLTGSDSDATSASGAPSATQRRNASVMAKAISAAAVDSSQQPPAPLPGQLAHQVDRQGEDHDAAGRGDDPHDELGHVRRRVGEVVLQARGGAQPEAADDEEAAHRHDVEDQSHQVRGSPGAGRLVDLLDGDALDAPLPGVPGVGSVAVPLDGVDQRPDVGHARC